MINRVVLCLCASAQKPPNFCVTVVVEGGKMLRCEPPQYGCCCFRTPSATDGRLRGPSFANTVCEMDGLISPFRGPERSSCLGLSSRNCLSEFAPLTLCVYVCVCGFNNAFTMKLI